MSSFNLAFRPDDYWSPPDPVTLITTSIKGVRRRDFVRGILHGVHDAELTDSLMTESLTPAQFRNWSQNGPSWVGGECLPDCRPGELEIARIIVNGPGLLVLSLRALRQDGQLAWRMVDEQQNTFRLPIDRSARPLAMHALIASLDGCAAHGPRREMPVLHHIWDRHKDPALWATFVESPYYPELEAYYHVEEARYRGFQWTAPAQRPG